MDRRRRGLGHVLGTPDFNLSVEFAYDAEYETKFSEAATTDTLFSVTLEYESGVMVSYIDCQIYGMTRSSREGEESTIKLEVTALDRVES